MSFKETYQSNGAFPDFPETLNPVESSITQLSAVWVQLEPDPYNSTRFKIFILRRSWYENQSTARTNNENSFYLTMKAVLLQNTLKHTIRQNLL